VSDWISNGTLAQLGYTACSYMLENRWQKTD